MDRVQGDQEESSGSDEYVFHPVGNRSVDPVHVQVHVHINGKPLKMEVDTGAALSVISEETRKAVFPEEKLWVSKLVLKT